MNPPSDHPQDDVDVGGRHLLEHGKSVDRRLPLERVVDQRQREAPRLPDRRVAAGQRQRPERRQPRELGVAGEEQLAAPRRAVGAVPGAVVGESQHGTAQAVLRHHARDMRVVMLHADGDGAVAAERVARRQVVGVEIVRDDLGRHVQELDPCARSTVS